MCGNPDEGLPNYPGKFQEGFLEEEESELGLEGWIGV